MIYSLNGLLVDKTPDMAVIVCGGVGYAVSCSANTIASLPSVGEEAFLLTIFSAKESGIELYGFSTIKERDVFKLLCGVSGVGAKVAFSVLSTYDPDRFALLVASGDFKALTACPGVGQRLAQRIVLEIKDKVTSLGSAAAASVVAAESSATAEAIAALTALGFTNAEAAQAVASLPADLDTQGMITAALRMLAMR